MCDRWPHNEDCFMHKTIQDPKIEHSAEIESIVRKILRPLLGKNSEDRKFVMRFSGSSNSAGHGSWGNQSYTRLIGPITTPVFKAANVQIDSRNMALGSLGAFPRAEFCQESAYGMDADFVSYEFDMFREGDCAKETWLRIVANMPRQPAVAFFNPGGYLGP